MKQLTAFFYNGATTWRIERRAKPDMAPAPAANRPLWHAMRQQFNVSNENIAITYARQIDAVADWFAAQHHIGAAETASLLRKEARRARESNNV